MRARIVAALRLADPWNPSFAMAAVGLVLLCGAPPVRPQQTVASPAAIDTTGTTTTPMLVAAVATDADAATRRVIDGTEIRLGVIPSDAARAAPRSPDGSAKTRDRPADASHRVSVELFDAESKSPIRNALIEARVRAPGSSVVKVLEPLMLTESIAYGNYFRMSGRGLYTITISVRLPSGKPEIHTSFQYRVP